MTDLTTEVFNQAWKKLGVSRVAVRSSGLREDGENRSFAGVFESVLNVPEDCLGEAIQTVQRSFSSQAATSYSETRETGGIIIQEMVDAEWAGVLFTRHPDHGGSALLEMVPGCGDSLVSGERTPQAYEVGRRSGALPEGVMPPIDIAPLLALGRKAEALFGRPQDIEWAYKSGQFYLLQSRDITRMRAADDSKGRIEAERSRLIDMVKDAAVDTVVLAQSEISELVPRPTPATLSLLESFWQPGGSVDLACRRLGLRYDISEDSAPYLISAFGSLYVNTIEEKRRTRPVSGFSAFRLARISDKMEARFREAFLPKFSERVSILLAVDPSRFNDESLFSLLRETRQRFIKETYVEASVINLLAALYGQIARRELAARGLDGEKIDVPDTIVMTTNAKVRALPLEEARRVFLSEFGQRAALDYELAQPRYGEDMRVADFALGHIRSASLPKAAVKGQGKVILERQLLAHLTRAGKFQSLKEDAKHHVLRELAVLRALILAIGERFGLGSDVFFLTLDEIEAMREPGKVSELTALAQQRHKDAGIFTSAGVVLPVSLTLRDLESIQFGEAAKTTSMGPGLLKGIVVSGSPPIEGRARVIAPGDAELGCDLGDLAMDTIVVSRFIHPRWLTEVTGARALLCEVGGWLSHTAILAREYDVPMIVGVKGLGAIEDGELIRLHADGSIERLAKVA